MVGMLTSSALVMHLSPGWVKLKTIKFVFAHKE
jgi:hypothetical protein